MKAVVLEKSGLRYTVLGQDGTFRQIHRRLNAEVGEEILIQPWIEYFSGVRVWAGAVALFLVVFTTIFGWTLYQAPTAVALLSVDINPSLQFELDNQGHLVKFETQDEDAKRMLSQIDLKGKPIEEVLEQIITQAYDQKFLSTEKQWVVVGYSPMTNKTLEQMPKELNENQIISLVTKIGESKGLIPQVAVFSLTSQERELAQKGDLTLGEYALWQSADKAGIVTQPEKLKETSERVRLLENPQVQVQIKAEKKERQSVLPQTPVTLKQEPGSKGKSGENITVKPLPVIKQFSPIKGVYPWIDNSRSQDDDKKKDQDKDNALQKNQSKYFQKTQNNNYTQQKTQNNNSQQNQNTNYSQQKNQTNVNEVNQQKSKEQLKYQQKDLNKDQQKDQNKTKANEVKETQQSKDNNNFVPKILTSRNLRRDTSHTYKFSEYDRDKQQSRDR